MPVILCHRTLSPHFTIHLNGFVPSFSVNPFYKKFWALSSILDKKNRIKPRYFGVCWENWRRRSQWLSYVSASHELSPFSGCFERGVGGVMLWLKMEFLLSCLPPAQNSCWAQGSSVPVGLSSCLATLQRAWEPQFRIWLLEVVLSAFVGDDLLVFLAPFNFQHMFTSICSPPSHGGWQFELVILISLSVKR